MRRTTTRMVAALVAVTALVVASLAGAAGAQQPDEPSTPSPARGGASSRLSPVLDALGAPQVQALGAETQAAALSVAPDGPGSLLVDRRGVLVEVIADDTGAATQAALTAAGATITFVAAGSITARVPVGALDAVADVPGVTYVTEVLEPLVGDPTRALEGPVASDGPVTSAAACPAAVTSEGDAHLDAEDARATFGVDGTGVKVGILSDSYDNLGGAATGVAAGELPGPGNLCGFTTPVEVQSDLGSGGTDEGRGMAEIVHDLAPGATLRFATAFNGQDAFAQEILDLQAAGADVIVDDVTYFAEPFFQDGVIASAVSSVEAAGAAYFSSAGNSTLTVGGKSVGSYEAPAFRASTCPAIITSTYGYINACHDFDPGAGTDAGDGFTLAAGGQLLISLGWDEPRYGVGTDLGAFLVDTVSGAVVAGSDAVNASSTRASEVFSFVNTSGGPRTFDLVVSRDGTATDPTGTPRFKAVLFTGSGVTAVEHDTSTGGDVVGPTLVGHHANQDQVATAAVRYDTTTAPEYFSSQGPAVQCWEPVVSGGPASAAMPCESKTIDLAATDGGANSFFGQLVSGTWRFFGTSAAAPHAAAVAALGRQLAPCAAPDQVVAALTATAAPVGTAGVDSVGAGLVDADAALAQLATTCPPTISGTVTASATGDPVEGVLVGAVTSTDTWFPSSTTTTAADGTYTLADLAAGEYRIVFAPPTSALLVGEWHDDVATRAAATPIAVANGDAVTGIDAALATATGMAGTVTIDGTGDPVAGATVSLYAPSDTWLPSASTTTGADGSWAVVGLDPGSYAVRVRGPQGTLLATEWFDDAGTRALATPVVVTAGAATTGIDAALVATAGLSGTVTGPTGQPLAGVTVAAFSATDTWVPSASATTASDGTYTLVVTAAGDHRVWFRAAAGSGLASEWHLDAATRATATPVAVTGATTLDAQLASA